jgi:hypothetical protein
MPTGGVDVRRARPSAKRRRNATESGSAANLATVLEGCFHVTKLARVDKTQPLKTNYVCRFCGNFNKTFEGPQRVAWHAMGCNIHGKAVRGCPVRGPDGKIGIPVDARNQIRTLYNLEPWSAQDTADQTAKEALLPSDSQAPWVEGTCIMQSAFMHC